MPLDRALICAYVFDEDHGVRATDGAGVESWTPGKGWIWVHLDRTSDETEPWLRHSAGLDPVVIGALVAEETRPRCEPVDGGMVLILRGVNMHAGADPEDMIAIRIWIDTQRVITMRARKLISIDDLRERLDRGEALPSPGALVVAIAELLVRRIGLVIEGLNDAIDQIEEDVLDAPSHELRTRLSRLRRRAIGLRRFLAPQREVVARLHLERHAAFTDVDRGRLRELTDRVTRCVEELDASRDRAAVTQEEISGRIADQMNRNMYTLSVVAGIFLPLGLLTGLLGINVGGIPGVDNQWGFTIVCVVLAVLATVAWWVFRRWRLL